MAANGARIRYVDADAEAEGEDARRLRRVLPTVRNLRAVSHRRLPRVWIRLFVVTPIMSDVGSRIEIAQARAADA